MELAQKLGVYAVYNTPPPKSTKPFYQLSFCNMLPSKNLFVAHKNSLAPQNCGWLHTCCSAQKVILVYHPLERGGWVDPGTALSVCSLCPNLNTFAISTGRVPSFGARSWRLTVTSQILEYYGGPWMLCLGGARSCEFCHRRRDVQSLLRRENWECWPTW